MFENILAGAFVEIFALKGVFVSSNQAAIPACFSCFSLETRNQR